MGLDPSAGAFFFYYLVVWIITYLFVSFGMVAGALFPSGDVAQTVIGIVIPLTFLFGGLYLPYPDIPIYWCAGGSRVSVDSSCLCEELEADGTKNTRSASQSHHPSLLLPLRSSLPSIRPQAVGVLRGPALLLHLRARPSAVPPAAGLRAEAAARVAAGAGGAVLPVHPGDRSCAAARTKTCTTHAQACCPGCQHSRVLTRATDRPSFTELTFFPLLRLRRSVCGHLIPAPPFPLCCAAQSATPFLIDKEVYVKRRYGVDYEDRWSSVGYLVRGAGRDECIAGGRVDPSTDGLDSH